jgi:GT2 family glycosyltransferase
MVEEFGHKKLDTAKPQLYKARPILKDISLIIPTLGRSILGECLYWVVSGSVWPEELIVVDQGVSDQPAAWIKMLNAIGLKTHHIPSLQSGRAAGVNRGLEIVHSRFAIVTDDDCFIDHYWVENMAKHLNKHPEAIITGRVEPAGEGEVDFCVVTSTDAEVHHRPHVKIQPLIGGNMGVSMENISKIGLYDEHPTLWAAEDNDWGYRALKKGIPIRYEPDTLVYHYGWRSSKQRADRYREYSRSQGGFYGKYLRKRDLFIFLQASRDLVRGPWRWLRGRILHNQDMIDRGKGDTLELLPGIISGFKRRNGIPQTSNFSNVYSKKNNKQELL